MNTLRSAALACVAAGSLAIPALAPAQTPTEDSVVGSLREPGYHAPAYDIDVRSGPSGEGVTGRVTYQAGFFELSTNAVCLKVSGNRATVVATAEGGSDVAAVKLTVVDSPPGEPNQSASTFTLNPSVLPSCETALAVAPVDGSVTVTDAQPSPTSKGQCKDGGWRSFGGTFDNQGQCVALVERGPKP